MLRYAVRRLTGAFLALFAVAVLTFVFLHLLPGDPAWAMLGRHATPAGAARLARELGLTLPIPAQFVRWAGYLFSESGLTGFSQAVPTLEFIVCGGALALVLSLLVAFAQERRRGSWLDRGLGLLAYIFYTMPSFWLGAMLVYFFALLKESVGTSM